MVDNDTAIHEAAHVAGCIAAAGWVPAEVRVDNPDEGIAGRCVANFRDHTVDTGYATAVAMGPLSEGHTVPWPPSLTGDTGDEQALARLVGYLKLDKHEYLTCWAFAGHLLLDEEVKEMVSLVARALSRVPVLGEDDLRELIGPETLDRFGIADPTLEGEPA